MKFVRAHWIFLLLLLLCTLLRFIPLFNYQFTYDELSALDRTQFSSFGEVIEKGVRIDAHPALVQVLLFYLVKYFGYTEWILKLPFLLMGHGAIIYAYCFGLRNFSRQSALLASLIFAFSLPFVFYAPVARPYISGVFFSMGLLYYFFEIVYNKRETIVNYFLLGLFALLSGLNQHINALFAFTVFASGLFFVRGLSLRNYSITAALVILFYLPHLPVTLYQLSVPGIGVSSGGWLTAPGLNSFTDLLMVLCGTGGAFVLFLLFLILALIKRKERVPYKKELHLLLLFILNFLVVYLYSILRSPIFQFSVMLFASTAFVLCLVSMLQFKNRILGMLCLGTVAFTLLYQSYYRKDYLRQSVQTVFDYQFERTVHYKKKYGSKNVYPLFFDCDTLMQKIYYRKYGWRFPARISSDKEISYGTRMFFSMDGKVQTNTDSMVSSLKLFSELINKLKCNYIIMSSASPLYCEIVKERFPYLLENTQTQANNFKLFSRLPSDQYRTVPGDSVLLSVTWDQKQNMIYSAPVPMNVRKENEFPLSVKGSYHDLIKKEGQVLISTAVLRMHSKENNSLESVVTINNENSNENYSYGGRSAADYLMKKDSTLTLYADQFMGTQHSKIKKNSTLNCFIWNRGRQLFEVKDFRIKVIDYWPRKWALWN